MKKHKKSYNNNKFKISAPTWNDKLRLPDGSYFVPNIQDYFNYILKNHNENIDNPSIRIYAGWSLYFTYITLYFTYIPNTERILMVYIEMMI